MVDLSCKEPGKLALFAVEWAAVVLLVALTVAGIFLLVLGAYSLVKVAP